MKLIRITLFWLIVFVLLGLFFGDTVIDTVVNGIFNLLISLVIADTWVIVFISFVAILVIGLIIYALLAKKMQSSLNLPKDLGLKQQTTDEFFADKPQALHDYHEQMLDNHFVLSETLTWEHNNNPCNMGIYCHAERSSLVGAIYHIKNIEINQIFVYIEFYESYDNNQFLIVNNPQFITPFLDISDDIVLLPMFDVATVRELLTVFKQASNKINAKPRPIVNFVDEINNFYHKQKQAEINKGYYIKSETGDYVATYKGVFCALYKYLPIVNWIYIYQRERYIKKWVNDVDE